MTTAAPALDLRATHARLRAAALADPFPDAAARRATLDRLDAAVLRQQEALIDAVNRDFGCRSKQETIFAEIFTTREAIKNARGNLQDWMRRRYRDVPLTLQPAKSWVEPQPLGVVGIIAPWNYPVLLALGPLAAALAAGNRVMLKPSEFTPATAALLQRLLGEVFAEDHVAVITGDAEVGRAFASLPFDHLLFTGSTAVGRAVMRAAAENLTPVTLELGGKSPALIAEDADLGKAADDIAYGKVFNAGQTCIAPDYVLAPRAKRAELIEALRAAARKFYPQGAADENYTAIVNDRHYARLRGYCEEIARRGVETVPLFAESGGRKIAPTLVLEPPDDLAVMQDEIFGPLLPVKTYETFAEALGYINARPRPLTLYLFTRSSGVRDEVARRTISGSLCVNDTLVHVADENLPFGGVGASGMGCYHGREGFETFSKLKPVFVRTVSGAGGVIRPPYGKVHRWMRKLLVG